MAAGLLNQFLAPDDGERCGILTSGTSYRSSMRSRILQSAGIGIAALFVGPRLVSQWNQYLRETVLTPFQSGTAAAVTGYLVNGAAQTGAAITVDTGTTTFTKGDIFHLCRSECGRS